MIVKTSHCPFIPGDRVRKKTHHSITDVVKQVPGMVDYDWRGFPGADEGMILENASWTWWNEWELDIPQPKHASFDHEYQLLKGMTDVWNIGLYNTPSPKGGIMSQLKKLTSFIKESLDSSLHSMYELRWIEIGDDEELHVTGAGRNALEDYLVLQNKEIREGFGAFAKKKADEIKKREKKECDA